MSKNTNQDNKKKSNNIYSPQLLITNVCPQEIQDNLNKSSRIRCDVKIASDAINNLTERENSTEVNINL
jgi:hypothetical protein